MPAKVYKGFLFRYFGTPVSEREIWTLEKLEQEGPQTSTTLTDGDPMRSRRYIVWRRLNNMYDKGFIYDCAVSRHNGVIYDMTTLGQEVLDIWREMGEYND